LIIGPGLVTKLPGDVVAQRQDLFQQRNVFRPGQIVMLDLELFADVLPFGIFFNGKEMPGDVGHDRVFVIAGFGLLQKTLGHAFEFGFGELTAFCALVMFES